MRSSFGKLIATALAVMMLASLTARADPTRARGHQGSALGPAGVPLADAPFDQQYIDMLARHHRTAIAMSKLAVRLADRARLEALAAEIVAAQQEELRALHELRERWYGDAAFTVYPLDERDKRMLGITPGSTTKLRRAEDFDHLYVDMITAHHAGAITLSRWGADDASHDALRELAEDVIAMQGEEIGVFNALHQSWFGQD